MPTSRTHLFYAVMLIWGALYAFGPPSEALATPTLINTIVTVNFNSPGNFMDFTDSVTVGAGNELSFSDGSNIGDNVFLDNEYIDIQTVDIVYHAQGGGSEIPGNPGYLDLGWGDPLAAFTFSGLFPATQKITGVDVFLSDAILLNPGTDVTFTDHSVHLVVGTLGILESSDNTGDIDLRLTVEDLAPPAPIPEPGSVVLVATGLIGLGAALARRRKNA